MTSETSFEDNMLLEFLQKYSGLIEDHLKDVHSDLEKSLSVVMQGGNGHECQQ